MLFLLNQEGFSEEVVSTETQTVKRKQLRKSQVGRGFQAEKVASAKLLWWEQGTRPGSLRKRKKALAADRQSSEAGGRRPAQPRGGRLRVGAVLRGLGTRRTHQWWEPPSKHESGCSDTPSHQIPSWHQPEGPGAWPGQVLTRCWGAPEGPAEPYPDR